MAATVVKGARTPAYAGVSATITSHTDEDYSRAFAEAVFDSTPTLKFLGLRAWNGRENFGSTRGLSGKGVQIKGGFQFSGKLAITAPTATLLTKGGNINAAERNDYQGWAYNWLRLVIALGIPEEDIQDNSGKEELASLMADELRLGTMGMIDSLSNLFHGTATSVAPTAGLKYLVGVTSASIGGIDSSSTSGWKIWEKDVGAPGGGGDIDKPLALRRALLGAIIGTTGYASSKGADLLISNIGAYLTIARLSEGPLMGIVQTDKVEKEAFDIGIPHMLIMGRPLINDKDATAPNGGTSGDFVYGIDTVSTGMAFHRKEYMVVKPWEGIREHDSQRIVRSNIFARCTPYTSYRRANFVLHGITENTEGVADNV